jgi:hypothetical protein
MATDPRYMSFDHQYVETVEVTDGGALTAGVEAHRFVLRTGAYASAGGYAAGTTVYDIPGQGELTDKGYQVDDGTNIVYEGQLNPSTTPYKPGVLLYQKLLSVVTEGIVIVEVGASTTIAVDGAVAAAANGLAAAASTGNLILGRSLDAIATGAGESGYIRVKLDQAGVSA